MTGATVKSITAKGLVVEQDGKRKTNPADTVIIAMGSASDNQLVHKLRNKISELHVIGDCFKPARIVDAVNHASYIGRHI